MEKKDIRKDRQGLPFFKSELNPMEMHSGIAFGNQYMDSKNPRPDIRDSGPKTQNPTQDPRHKTQNSFPGTLDPRLMTPLVREHMQKDMERLRSTIQLNRIMEPAFQMIPKMNPKMMAMNADPRTGEADLRGLMPSSFSEKKLPDLVHERKLHGPRHREPSL